jgi:hypothetical protein
MSQFARHRAFFDNAQSARRSFDKAIGDFIDDYVNLSGLKHISILPERPTY